MDRAVRMKPCNWTGGDFNGDRFPVRRGRSGGGLPVVLGILLALLATTSACSVDIPEGKLPCNGPNDYASCPEGWYCFRGHCYATKPGSGVEEASAAQAGSTASDVFDPFIPLSPGQQPPSQAGDGSAGGSGTGAPPPPGCVAQTTTCEAECGTIFDECGQPIECGQCPPNTVCVDLVCVSECGGCQIDGVCHQVGGINPNNACEVCSPASSSEAWSPNDGVLCDDGRYCTVLDACAGGICRGMERDCDDGVNCNGQEMCSDTTQQCEPGTSICEPHEYCDASSDTCVSSCSDCAISGTCYANGSRSPGNECLVCDVSANRDQWTVAVGETCGDAATECSARDTCDADGNCQPNHEEEGVLCGAGPTECSEQDACDGRGNCLPHDLGTNVACGTPAECRNQGYCDGQGACDEGSVRRFGDCGDGPTECSGQDTCSLLGVCQPNHLSEGTACGPTAGVCAGQDICDGQGECIEVADDVDGTLCGPDDPDSCYQDICSAGSCITAPKAAGSTCGTPGECEAQDLCNSGGTCVDSGPVENGTNCGEGATECSGQDTCQAGICAPNHFGTDQTCGSSVDPGGCEEQDYCDGNGGCADSGYKDAGDQCGSDPGPCRQWSTCVGAPPSMSCQEGALFEMCTPCDDGDPSTENSACNAGGVCMADLPACAS